MGTHSMGGEAKPRKARWPLLLALAVGAGGGGYVGFELGKYRHGQEMTPDKVFAHDVDQDGSKDVVIQGYGRDREVYLNIGRSEYQRLDRHESALKGDVDAHIQAIEERAKQVK